MNGNRKPLHEALGAAAFVGGSGGSGGTSDYSDLTNKPSINSVTLNGNKTSADLGLQAELTFDSVPTDGSTNPVESNGIYDALAGKQDTIDSSHKLSADLVDDSTSTNKLAHVDSSGGLWIGSTQYIKIIDRASYDALTTKDDMIYMVYPTPTRTPSLSMGGGAKNEISEGGDEKPEEKELKEPIVEGKEDFQEKWRLNDSNIDEPMAMRSGGWD